MQITLIIDRFPCEPGGVKMVVCGLADRLSLEHDVVLAVLRKTPRGAFREPSDEAGERWRLVHHDLGLGSRLLSVPAKYVVLPGLRRWSHGRVGLPAARLFGMIGGHSLGRVVTRPDVVHSFTSDMTGHLALGLGRAVGAPVVITGFPHPGQYGDGPIDKSAYRQAASVVALTEQDRNVYLGLGVNPEQIAVIPPPSDDLGTDARQAARSRLGVAGALVVFAGVRRDYKGADILYAAAPLVGAAVEGATIAFVGPGPALAPVPGVDIRDTGEVSTKDMADWIRAADVLVLPSLHEILPIVVLDAWSAAVPVVVSDTQSLRHLISESGGGIAVAREPEAVSRAIVLLLGDEQTRLALGQSGRSYWEKHCGEERVGAAHAELYARLMRVRVD